MTLELVKKYFDDDDKFVGLRGEHPLKPHFDACGGIAYIKRVRKDLREIVFRCTTFGGAHVVRECKDNCPNFKMCAQITLVREKEAVFESLYPMIAE